MSRNLESFICPMCGSIGATYDPIDGTVRCKSCAYPFEKRRLQYIPQEETGSSASGVAGTDKPEFVVETEEFGYRKKTMGIFPHTREEFDRLEREVSILRNDVNQLGQKVEELSEISPKVVVVEEVPKEEAKGKIEEYFKEHETADIEELMLNLKMPVQTIVEIIDELKREGKISTQKEEKT